MTQPDATVIGLIDLAGGEREALVGEIARLDVGVRVAESLATLEPGCDLIVAHVRAVPRDGWEALTAGAPTIVISERLNPDDRVKAVELGLIDYVIEPLRHSVALRRLIRRSLGLDHPAGTRETETSEAKALEGKAREGKAREAGVSETEALEAKSSGVASLDTKAHDAEIHEIGVHEESRAELQALNERLERHLEILREDQRAGGHVQRKLLPPPGVRHLDVCCDYWFAPSLYLSGDFLDFQRCDERYSFFYFADVAGHGASSAFVTVLLRYLCNRWLSQWRTLLPEAFPSRWLGELNRELIETGIGKHATVFAGVLDHERRFLHYALGAQLPMPILQTDSVTTYLGGEGPPVGLFPDVEYPIYGCPLPERFRLWFCSDGVLECLPSTSLDARLRELERRVSRCTRVEQLKDGLALGDQLPDDLSMMTLTGFEHD